MTETLGLLRIDRSPDLLETTPALLVTEIDLLVRHDEYCEFPCKIFRLIQKFNPTTHLSASESFMLMTLRTFVDKNTMWKEIPTSFCMVLPWLAVIQKP